MLPKPPEEKNSIIYQILKGRSNSFLISSGNQFIIVDIDGDVVTVEVKKGAHLEISRYSISEVLEKE